MDGGGRGVFKMSKVHQIFENLYDVNGYLLLLDPDTFDPTTEDGCAELLDFTEYIRADDFLCRYGKDTVVCIIHLPQKGKFAPTPCHVSRLPEPMLSVLQRYRYENT